MSALKLNPWGGRSLAAVACCTGLAVCGGVFADDGSTRSMTVSSSSDDGTSTMTIVDTREGRTVKLELKNEQVVHAEFNGKAVPADRVVREGDTIRLKDENGNVVYEHTLSPPPTPPIPPAPPQHPIPPAAPRAPRAWSYSHGDGHGGRVHGLMAARSNNKSMVGLRLGEVESALRGHFGLKPGEATMVWSVSEGLPADQAGIAPYDIIIGIDGKSPANEEFVRATLKDKDPGAKVEIKVIHRGQEKGVTVTTEKWDAEKLEKAKNKSAAMLTGAVFGNMDEAPFAWSGGGVFEKIGPEIERAYEQAMQELNILGFSDDDEETPGAEEEDAPEDGAEPGMSMKTPAPSPRAQERLRVIMRRLGGEGDPIVATITGPDGQPRPQVFVSPRGMNERARELQAMARDRANQLRDSARQQEDLRREMDALHRRLMELQPKTAIPPPPGQQDKSAPPPGTGQS